MNAINEQAKKLNFLLESIKNQVTIDHEDIDRAFGYGRELGQIQASEIYWSDPVKTKPRLNDDGVSGTLLVVTRQHPDWLTLGRVRDHHGVLRWEFDRMTFLYDSDEVFRYMEGRILLDLLGGTV